MNRDPMNVDSERARASDRKVLDKQGFDEWADSYDEEVEMSDVYPFAGYREVREEIIRQVAGTQGDRVLDLGFGTGNVTARLYALGYKITGLDFSEQMIRRARVRMPDAQLLEWDFTRELPQTIREEKYNVVVLTYSIHHLVPERQLQLLSDLLSMLADGGRILIGDVLTETEEELEAARKKDLEVWDDAENYLVVERLREQLPACRLTFHKKSYCSGVLVIELL